MYKKVKVHPTTGHEGPKGGRGIALLFKRLKFGGVLKKYKNVVMYYGGGGLCEMPLLVLAL
jgi:hypothetical protein